jgi:hypothetical protein
MQAEIEAALREHEVKLTDIAGQNIRAETQSDDKYTKRMRPTFGYIVCFILLWNFVITPLFKDAPLDLPEALYWLFGSTILGYVGARSFDKYSSLTANGNGKK